MIDIRPREVRDRCGLNQRELAAIVGVHPMTVSKFERGGTDWTPPALARFWPALVHWTALPDARRADLRFTLRRYGPQAALAVLLAEFWDVSNLLTMEDAEDRPLCREDGCLGK